MLYYRTYESSPNHDWVVFFHGIGGSHSIFYKQIKAFKKHYNLLLIDFPGHGRSNVLQNETYTYEKVGKEVIKVMDHLKIRRAHMMGVSLGTIIINQLVQMVPDRIHSIIQGGAVLRFTPFTKLLGKVGDIGKHVLPYMWLYHLFAWLMMPKKHHRDARMAFVKEAKKLGKKEFIRWYRLGLKLEGVFKKIKGKAIPIPLLYIMGSEDYMFLKAAEKAAHENPYAAIHVIEKCGHVCNIECPDRFNRAVLAFLQKGQSMVG